MTDEQREREREQGRIREQRRYTLKQKQLREQFLNIGCYSLDEYAETMVAGNDIENGRHRFGRMDNVCTSCQALKWKHETKGFCCQGGQIRLQLLHSAPQPLLDLLTSTDANANTYIRLYNSIFAFTSIQADIDKDLANADRGVYTYQLHGALYHQYGGLLPRDDPNQPTFAQIYFHDSNFDNQLQVRTNMYSVLDPDVLGGLQQLLH